MFDKERFKCAERVVRSILYNIMLIFYFKCFMVTLVVNGPNGYDVIFDAHQTLDHAVCYRILSEIYCSCLTRKHCWVFFEKHRNYLKVMQVRIVYIEKKRRRFKIESFYLQKI